MPILRKSHPGLSGFRSFAFYNLIFNLAAAFRPRRELHGRAGASLISFNDYHAVNGAPTPSTVVVVNEVQGIHFIAGDETGEFIFS